MLSLFSTTISYTSTPAHAAPLDLHQLSDQVALEWKIPTTTLANLVSSESHWNPMATSTTHDCGLTQINITTNPSGKPVPCEQAQDPVFALNFAAKYIAAGKASQWTVCNCYSYVKSRIHDLPLENHIVANTTPRKGVVAIFEYNGMPHFGIIKDITADGFDLDDANYSPCLVQTHFISWDDPHLKGFWSDAP